MSSIPVHTPEPKAEKHDSVLHFLRSDKKHQANHEWVLFLVDGNHQTLHAAMKDKLLLPFVIISSFLALSEAGNRDDTHHLRYNETRDAHNKDQASKAKAFEADNIISLNSEKETRGGSKSRNGKGEFAEKKEKTRKLRSKTKGNNFDCDEDGFSSFPYKGMDSSQRLLLREGLISKIPTKQCPKDRGASGKNVILVIGDGMGWEMVRAGSIARQVIDELADLGCDVTLGECLENLKQVAKDQFGGRTLEDYYTEGKGYGLSFQDWNMTLMTTTSLITQKPNPGNYNSPPHSLLAGSVKDHDSGMAELALNKCGFPIDFNPLDFEKDGGNMVLWDDNKGGTFPWDYRYYQDNTNPADADDDAYGKFDPTYIMRHAADSASTAGTMATGHKSAASMLSQNMYEEDVRTLVEDAIYCGKAGGVVTSVPVFHATPAAFILHTNFRDNRNSLRRSFETGVSPTLVSGVCGARYYPFPETLQGMRDDDDDDDGALSSTKRKWTLLEQSNDILSENFYDREAFTSLDPDTGDHLFVCLGGDFTESKRNNLPYRGVDSSYSNRWCSSGSKIQDPISGTVMGVQATTSETLCNHYSPEEIRHIPPIKDNVMAALDFLGKAKNGFFLLYEQGDIDWAVHANHMDDMLGTMLDLDDSVKAIVRWIEDHGGFEKTALYVTADHDHYLTLLNDFPETLATLLIDGASHNITPRNNSHVNPWTAAGTAAIQATAGGGKSDDSIIQHLKTFATWTEEDMANVSHFWGPRGSGGNGWAWHTSRPVPLFHRGDEDCIDSLVGKGFQVLGRDVAATSPNKVDQMHLHACLLKHMLAL